MVRSSELLIETSLWLWNASRFASDVLTDATLSPFCSLIFFILLQTRQDRANVSVVTTIFRANCQSNMKWLSFRCNLWSPFPFRHCNVQSKFPFCTSSHLRHLWMEFEPRYIFAAACSRALDRVCVCKEILPSWFSQLRWVGNESVKINNIWQCSCSADYAFILLFTHHSHTTCPNSGKSLNANHVAEDTHGIFKFLRNNQISISVFQWNISTRFDLIQHTQRMQNIR